MALRLAFNLLASTRRHSERNMSEKSGGAAGKRRDFRGCPTFLSLFLDLQEGRDPRRRPSDGSWMWPPANGGRRSNWRCWRKTTPTTTLTTPSPSSPQKPNSPPLQRPLTVTTILQRYLSMSQTYSWYYITVQVGSERKQDQMQTISNR